MNKLPVLITIFLLLTKISFTSVLEGQNKEYAEKEIIFYTYSDPVSKAEKKLFSIQFDGEGKFKTEVQVSKTTFVFCEFGIYRGEFFLEPAKTIHPVFPPLREKSFADQKNPFFEPVLFWFSLQNEKGLNQKILDFEAQYNLLTNTHFNQLYFRQSKEIFDTVVNTLNQKFPTSTNPVFENHKKLRIKFLESEVFRQNPEDGSEILATVPEDMWEHPAFISYFERVFTNRLSFDAKNEKGSEIKRAVATNNISYLTEFVKNKYQLNGSIVQLATLKMLYDAFYSGEFPQNAILQILDSDNWKDNSDNKIVRITDNTIEKLTFLRPGTEAPKICLEDITGTKKCSDDNREKFKYLVFADIEMVVCQEQLKYLTRIEEMFQQNLEIILVLRDTDLNEIKNFLDSNRIPGEKFLDKNEEFIQKFRIRAFPTCILLDEDHKVVFQDTKAPLDGFEQQFGAYLQQELFRRQRNQVR